MTLLAGSYVYSRTHYEIQQLRNLISKMLKNFPWNPGRNKETQIGNTLPAVKTAKYSIKLHHLPCCLKSSGQKCIATTYPTVCESSLLNSDNDYVSLPSSMCLQVLAATKYYYNYSQDVIRVTEIK